MIQRCHSPNDPGYPYYGACGLSVCEAWRESFDVFIQDVGPRPSSRHTIERIDNDRDYEPGNVRWATMKEQSNNKRSNVRLEYKGETLTISQWSARTGIPANTIQNRVRKRGWTVERALTTPGVSGSAIAVRERQRQFALMPSDMCGA